MEITTKIMFINKPNDKNNIKVGFESNVSAFLPADHILFRKATVGYVITFQGLIFANPKPNNEKEYYLNAVIHSLVAISKPVECDRFADLPDIDAPKDNVRHLQSVGTGRM